jgi:hypothetical protein
LPGFGVSRLLKAGCFGEQLRSLPDHIDIVFNGE